MSKEKKTKDVKQEVKKDEVREVDKKVFVVVKPFTDLQDKNKKYKVNDVYPTEGKTATRIKEMSTTNNRRKEIVIEERV